MHVQARRTGSAVVIGCLLLIASRGDCLAQPSPLQQSSRVTFVRFLDRDKRVLMTCQDGSIRIVETANGAEVRRADADAPPKTLGSALAALGPDGQTLAIVTQEGRIRLWTTATLKQTRSIDLNEAKRLRVLGAVSLAFAPDGRTLAVRSKDQVVHLVDLDKGTVLRSFGESSRLRPFHGNFFAGGAGSDTSLLFLSDNLGLYSARVDDMGQLAAVRLWGLGPFKGKELLASMFRFNNPLFDARTGFGVTSLVMRKDDALAAWASSDGTARLLNVGTEKEIRRLPAVQQGVYIALVFSPNGSLLAARTSNSSAIRLFDVASGKELHVLGDSSVTPNKKWAGDEQTLSFSADSKRLVEGNANTIRLWDVDKGQQIMPQKRE